MKKSFWVVEAVVRQKFKVSFEDDVDMSEAAELFSVQEGIEDILDESEIIEVISVDDVE